MRLDSSRLTSLIQEEATVFGSLNHLLGGAGKGRLFSVPRMLTMQLRELVLELLDGRIDHLLQLFDELRLLAIVLVSFALAFCSFGWS